MKCEVRWKSVMSNSPVFYNNYQDQRASLLAQTVKNLPAMWDTQVHSLGWEDPWRKAWLPTPVFLPGGFHEQRSLAGYSPWGCKVGTNGVTYIHTHRDQTWLPALQAGSSPPEPPGKSSSHFHVFTHLFEKY